MKTLIGPVVELRAEDVMEREVLVVDAHRAVTEVLTAMQQHGREHAVVTLHGTCVGVVALSEMAVAWGLELAPVARRSVLPLVTPTPCVSADTGLSQLCRLLLRTRFGAVMVLDAAGRLEGLVTVADVLTRLAHDDED